MDDSAGDTSDDNYKFKTNLIYLLILCILFFIKYWKLNFNTYVLVPITIFAAK